MALALAPIEWTEEEYLELEDASETKHEFLDGHVSALPAGEQLPHNAVCGAMIGILADLLRDQRTRAMAGATEAHNTTSFNTGGALRRLIRRGPCRGFTSDQRIHVPRPKKYYTYPDGGVVCGKSQFHPKGGKQMVLMNPSLLFEVLSPRTEKHDRTTKLMLYRQIESLQDVLLVDPKTKTVEHHHRGPRGWKVPVKKHRGAIKVLGGEIQVTELFEGLE